MSLMVERRKDLVHIRGEMTIYNAVPLTNELFKVLSRRAKKCSLDLSEVSEFDSTGLQLLLMAQRNCEARNVPFTVVDPSAVVRETLDLLRLRRLPLAFTGREA